MQRRQVFTALATSPALSLLPSNSAHAAGGNAGGFPSTSAETKAGIAPIAAEYPEGDIRRYGGNSSAADNSKALNSALLVSANGGSAAFLPPGTWRIAATVNCVLSSSMYGMGQMSVLAPQSCDGLTFSSQPAYAGSRYFRDFSINGTGCQDNIAIVARLPAAAGNRITGVQFANLTIQNFSKGAYLRGLWNSVFRDCFLYNNSIGYHLQGQNIQIRIDGGLIQLGAHAPVESTFGVLVDSVAGESTQSLHMTAVGLYGFNINIALVLALYTSIQNCDISASRSIGVQIITVQGGTTLRDCWIQTNAGTSTTAVQIAPRSSPATDRVTVEGCTLVCDIHDDGSTGIFVGQNQLGVVTNGNTIGTRTAPFAYGIDNGGARNHIAKFNTIFASTTAIKISAQAADSEVGPNTIQNGTPLDFSGQKPRNFNYSAPGGAQ